MKRIVCFSLLLAFLPLTGFASVISRIPLAELQDRSDLIVMAKVTKVVMDGDNDHVTVEIDSYLKGESPQTIYTITLCSRGGLKDYDPALKEGDTGVFFLKRSKQEGEVEKAYWSSIAIFNKNSFDLTKKDPNQPDEGNTLGILKPEEAVEQTVPSADYEYKVYSYALLQLGKEKSDIQKDVLVIRKETVLRGIDESAKRHSFLKENFGELVDDDLVNEFLAINSKSAELENKFAKVLNIILISKETEDKIFNPVEGGWKRFYSEYPKSSGIIELSKVAFNADKTQALLYYGSSFDSGKGGVGYYILLKNRGNKWIIQKMIMCGVA